MKTAILQMRDVTIAFGGREWPTDVVTSASLSVGAGEFHAIVGESGSGKTMLARAALGLLPPGGRVRAGSITFDGTELVGLGSRSIRALRGKKMGMVFQDPLTSLNPSMRIGAQMCEATMLHEKLSVKDAQDRAIDMLARVGIPHGARALGCYPHEFSGGMRQRIMIASTLLLKPQLLIADEPTTALDAIVQADIMDLIRDVTRDLGTAVLMISHDLGLVADRADRVSVMDAGVIVEAGPVDDILIEPRHAKTKALLAALPQGEVKPPQSAQVAPLLHVTGAHVSFAGRKPWPWAKAPHTHALRDVDITLCPGETLAIVGASGSGKTTLGRAIAGLQDLTSGRIQFGDADITHPLASRRRELAREIQIVFQDPMGSLDPRVRVGDSVAEGLRHTKTLSRADRRKKALTTLTACGLDEDFAARFPHQLSGGQRQRVGIARALIMQPKIIVLDEPVSALDVTVQAQVLDLLERLQRDHDLSYIFISHDLGVVESIANRVMVMEDGIVVEEGHAAEVFRAPQHPFTCRLLSILPELKPQGRGYRLVRRQTHLDPATRREESPCPQPTTA
ncbi:MAG: ABC transporter ATP-binding protein [Hyphomonas sp.]|nr:ABC transporter ATP-binding protein [Hyphomonas sp.]